MLTSVRKKLAEHGSVRDEKGSILVFVLVVFSAMFLVGGTAVDLARHENLRSSIQYNLDRAVLAAASLKQTQDPNTVVQDYMSKINTIDTFSVNVTSVIATNSRSVTATATANLDTWFLSMAGINQMPITARSQAEEKIPKLEISVVLDVSGSMNGSKLSNLKVAAKDFVTTMLTGADPNTVSLSIIPFNQTSTPPTTMYDALTVNEQHNYSTCLQFTDADFANVAIDPAVTQTQAVYTSAYTDNGGFNDLDDWYRTCYTDDYFEIMAYSQSESGLHTKIDSLVANGMTSGHMGLKWGLALLDPKFDSVVDAMIAEGEVDAAFNALPAPYTDHETMKVVILMGDGGNTYEWKMGSSFRGANSNLYEVNYTVETFQYAYHKNKVWKKSYSQSKCGKKKWICVYDTESFTDHYLRKPSNNQYLDIDSNQWISQTAFNNLPSTLSGWTSTVRLDWEDAWGLMSPSWYDSKVGGSAAFNDLYYNSSRSYGQSDTVMASACDAAATKGIVVYTIGFQTNSTTSAKLRDCASTPSHYYDAAGTQISTVFQSIAASIQKLKLTQ